MEAEQLASVTERHPDVFKVLIREIGQDGKADVVLGKALCVLPETELPATCWIAGSALIIGLHRPALASLSEKPTTQ